MALFMAQLDSKFRFSAVDITDDQPAFISEARSGKRLVRRIPGAQKFIISAKTVPINNALRRELRAFLSKRGSFDSFDIVLPSEFYSLGTASGVVTLNGAHLTGDTSISLNIAGDLAPGDMITFAGHSKVYQVVSFTTGTAEIWPPLKQSASNLEVVNYDGVKMKVYNSSVEITNELSANGGLSNVELELIEAV